MLIMVVKMKVMMMESVVSQSSVSCQGDGVCEVLCDAEMLCVMLCVSGGVE